MSEIPDDIMKVARDLDMQFWNQDEPEETITELVYKAILAERERCAAIIQGKADHSKLLWDEFIASGRNGPASSSHTAYYAWVDEIMNGTSATTGEAV